MISICLTFKNRAIFLDLFCEMIKKQQYDLKKVELCLSVASDNEDNEFLQKVIDKNYKYFYQISYLVSDRNKLPFKIINNPTCDINSQICNQPRFDKIIRTDPEVIFTNSLTLDLVEKELNDQEKCIWFGCLDSLKFLNSEDVYKLIDNRNIINSYSYKCRYLNGFFLRSL